MKLLLKIFIPLVVLACIIALFSFLYINSTTIKVSVTSPMYNDVKDMIIASSAGTIVSEDEAILAPESSGLIKVLMIEEGQFVNENEILLQMEDEADQNSLKLAEDEFAIAQKNLIKLETEYGNSTKIYAAEIAKATTTLEASKKNLTNTKFSLNKKLFQKKLLIMLRKN